MMYLCKTSGKMMEEKEAELLLFPTMVTLLHGNPAQLDIIGLSFAPF